MQPRPRPRAPTMRQGPLGAARALARPRGASVPPLLLTTTTTISLTLNSSPDRLVIRRCMPKMALPGEFQIRTPNRKYVCSHACVLLSFSCPVVMLTRDCDVDCPFPDPDRHGLRHVPPSVALPSPSRAGCEPPPRTREPRGAGVPRARHPRESHCVGHTHSSHARIC